LNNKWYLIDKIKKQETNYRAEIFTENIRWKIRRELTKQKACGDRAVDGYIKIDLKVTGNEDAQWRTHLNGMGLMKFGLHEKRKFSD
jgi:hypothetical protein